MTVRIVTDSACDISLDEAAQLNIKIVPLSIRFGEEEFTDLAAIFFLRRPLHRQVLLKVLSANVTKKVRQG